MIGSDGMPSSAEMLAGDAQHGSPLRGGMLHMDELPLADSRTAAYIIRDAGPVARDGHGAYLAIEAGAASYVLRHPELFSSKRASGSPGSPIPIVPVASGPPGHTRYRQVLRSFFGAPGTARWLPVVRALAAELTGRFTGRGERDLVAEVALSLPAEVFLTVSGLPPADRDWLVARKETVLGAVGISDTEPPSDASVQLAAELPAAIEELLRFDGPVVTLPRVAAQDVELAGQVIPADSYVAVAVAAANRDPAEHRNPEAVDFHRDGRHVALGAGPHGCLGARLARLEMRVVPEEWAPQDPRLSAGTRGQ